MKEELIILQLMEFQKFHKAYDQTRIITPNEKLLIENYQKFTADHPEISLARSNVFNANTAGAHGTNAWTLFSAFAWSDAQLLPKNMMKVKGIPVAAGELLFEKSKSNYYYPNTVNQNLVSTIDLKAKDSFLMDAWRYADASTESYQHNYDQFKKKFLNQYCNSSDPDIIKKSEAILNTGLLNDIYHTLSQIPVVIIGDGIGRININSSIDREVGCERVNIRAILIDKPHQQLISKIIREINPNQSKTIVFITREEINKFEWNRPKKEGAEASSYHDTEEGKFPMGVYKNTFIQDFLDKFCREIIPFSSEFTRQGIEKTYLTKKNIKGKFRKNSYELSYYTASSTSTLKVMYNEDRLRVKDNSDIKTMDKLNGQEYAEKTVLLNRFYEEIKKIDDSAILNSLLEYWKFFIALLDEQYSFWHKATLVIEQWFKQGFSLEKSIDELNRLVTRIKEFYFHCQDTKKVLAFPIFSTTSPEIIDAITEKLSNPGENFENFAEFFSHIDQKIPERKLLGRLLLHKILIKDQPLYSYYHTAYLKLIKSAVPRPLKVSKFEEQQLFTQIGRLLEELKCYTLDKLPDTNRESSLLSESQKTEALKQLTAPLIHYYSPFFSTVNNTRKRQAKKLFKEISALIVDSNDFYPVLLEKIAQTQEDILISDKKTRRNKKGYSRLLDITVDLQAQILTQWLQDDPEIFSKADKVLDCIERQVEKTIQILTERLEESTSEKLKAARDSFMTLKCINVASTTTKTEGQFSRENTEALSKWVETHYNNIPNYLVYLLDHIKICIKALPMPESTFELDFHYPSR